MTRLKDSDIDRIAGDLAAYDARLRTVTGAFLMSLACRAAGCDEEAARQQVRSVRVRGVPMTCGLGIITNFCATLCATARYLGFEARVTRATDGAGLAEAYEGGADIILLADDHRFVAIDTGRRRVVDNATATGKGFVAGLDRMAGGLSGRSVLVIGCGPVGQSAALAAARAGATVSLFDAVRQKAADFAGIHPGCGFALPASLPAALAGNELIVEATPAENVIDEAMIHRRMLIAAPGVPCGVSAAGRKRLRPRLLWDPLQLGVATMLIEAALAA
jgi:3-methylornithyl-N6-L-lysine dehydrogenase